MSPRPFFVSPYFECPFGADEARRIPPHRLVIEPLVRSANEIRVFQNLKYPVEVELPPHFKEHSGRYCLDLSHELVRGWERFWNVGCWRRGAVTLRIPIASIDWSEVFSWTEYGGVWASRYQIAKSTPKGAINYCDKNAVASNVVVCLSASNGIKEMDVWCDVGDCAAMDQLAQSSCRHFVREVEIGKFAREIVYDISEYRGLV